MAATVCSALGLDKENFAGKLIAIEEHHGSDGNFVLNSIISEQAQKNCGICLIALHNSFGHYHNVGTKLGYNLHQRQERGYIETIEVLKLLTNSLCASSEHNFMLSDGETAMISLFSLVKEKVNKLLQNNNFVSLIIDNLSDLMSLGISTRDVLSFFQYCRSLLLSDTRLSLTVLTHVAENDEEQHLLTNGVAHVADMTIAIRGLKTGQSSNVSGAMKITRKHWDKSPTEQEWNVQNFYHFKLLDRQVKVFAPGTAPSFT